MPQAAQRTRWPGFFFKFHFDERLNKVWTLLTFFFFLHFLIYPLFAEWMSKSFYNYNNPLYTTNI